MVRKAVIPAAGLGTRFLPATKAQPKEMMPVVGKPVIQYVVEEAVASGIEDVLIVTGRGKRSIQEHFDKSYELERELERAGKLERLEQVKRISELADIHYVRQKERRGLGDAVLYAEQHVDDEPFALLLGDTIVKGEPPCTQVLVERFEDYRSPVIALEPVNFEEVEKYGIARVKGRLGGSEDRCYEVQDLVEKPGIDGAPSNLAIVGRYVLGPEIFEALRETEVGRGEELQLTDALRSLGSVMGCRVNGRRFDIGNIPDWLMANQELNPVEGVVVSE